MSHKLVSLVACLLVVVGLTGCAGVGGGAADNDRLVNAISIDDVHTVRGAVQSGGLNPDARVSVEAYPDGAPIIAIAARAAALEVMRFLISSGADLNARTPVNETPLMLAAFFFDESNGARSFDRHERAVRLLVESGAQLENDYFYTPLAYAAYQGNERVVRYLLERGARPNGAAQQGGTYSNTPLMMAAMQGHERIVRMLLAAGADADVRVYGGHTAAEFAAKYNHHTLAQLLQCAQRQYGTSPVGINCRAMLGFAQQ
jgi:uncharacterized protein